MKKYYSDEEVEIQRESASLVSKTLAYLASEIKEGMSTMKMDEMAEVFIRDHGGVPSFKGYGEPGNAFPASLCISVNDAVVHGFPSSYEVKPGDVLSIDCGIYKNGFHGDHAYTFIVGDAPEEIKLLVERTKASLYAGIEQAIVGNRTGDIGYAVEQATFKKYNYGVVRELVGHGVGRNLHEDPQVPNYGRRGSGKRLIENMILAIEPMINLGTRHVFTDQDGWTIRTTDGKPSVHFEHNVCVKKEQPIILSDYSIIELAEKNNSNLLS